MPFGTTPCFVLCDTKLPWLAVALTLSRIVSRSHLVAIQGRVDSLNLENFSNLSSWVARLDSRVEDVLAQRLEAAVRAWVAAFSESGGRRRNSLPDAAARR